MGKGRAWDAPPISNTGFAIVNVTGSEGAVIAEVVANEPFPGFMDSSTGVTVVPNAQKW